MYPLKLLLVARISTCHNKAHRYIKIFRRPLFVTFKLFNQLAALVWCGSHLRSVRTLASASSAIDNSFLSEAVYEL